MPWSAPAARSAGTVHLAGRLREIVASEKAVARGGHSKRPYVLVAQQSLVDSTRAPAGRHTLWAYCHVPNGSTTDMTEAIEHQIERFAPGFGELVLARATRGPAELEAENPNYVGGDINGGARQPVAGAGAPGAAARTPTRRPTAGCCCAPPRRPPAAACTACAASTPRGRRCAGRYASGTTAKEHNGE